ncbi:MAG: DUF1801 domain-containing protein [Thermoactinospora sp.]|nr:DUF1801 domain-containing protein [Thermoactinospora sp.]
MTAKTTTATKTYDGFSEEERAAMKAHAEDLKATSRRGTKGDAESEVLAKIAEMQEADRVIAERVHTIVKSAAPGLISKLWYGMPAYAHADGKIVCFFQPAPKFKARYATLGFNDSARLDDGTMWPTSYALTTLTEADEARLTALIKQAVS